MACGCAVVVSVWATASLEGGFAVDGAAEGVCAAGGGVGGCAVGDLCDVCCARDGAVVVAEAHLVYIISPFPRKGKHRRSPISIPFQFMLFKRPIARRIYTESTHRAHSHPPTQPRTRRPRTRRRPRRSLILPSLRTRYTPRTPRSPQITQRSIRAGPLRLQPLTAHRSEKRTARQTRNMRPAITARWSRTRCTAWRLFGGGEARLGGCCCGGA